MAIHFFTQQPFQATSSDPHPSGSLLPLLSSEIQAPNTMIEVDLSDSDGSSSDSDDEQYAEWRRRASAQNYGFVPATAVCA